MAGVSSGVGIFSGIDSQNIITQLLALDAVPKQQAQSRITQLQVQKAAYLDLNSRLQALKTAAGAFRTNKIFQTKGATSSLPDVLGAVASTTAAAGTYTFQVDRLVSTQQLLSSGFANKDSAAVGATSISFESTQARLDRDVALADLHGGLGVSRGKILVTDSAGHAATVDLSRTVTINEVLDAINSNGTAQVTASVQSGKLVLNDTAHGVLALNVADASGYTTATSLGIAGTATGTTLTGNMVYSLASTTSLAALNDGNGVSIKSGTGTGVFNFTINVGGATPAAVNVNLGDVYVLDGTDLKKTEGAVTTVGGVVTRINAALAAANIAGVTASVDSTNGRLLITDSTGTQPLTVADSGGTTAADLGLTTTPVSGSIQGRRVFAGLNSTLARSLNGGAGISGDGLLKFTSRDGTAFSVTVDPNASITDIFSQIETASGIGTNGLKRFSVSLDNHGTGIQITDNTGASGNLIITGTPGADSATSLGIATGVAGIAATSKSSGNLQHQYLSRASLVSSLNNGKGIGTGKFKITDSSGLTSEVDIGDDTKTLGDLIDEINGRPGLQVIARINTNGDGIEIVQNPSGPQGSVKIKVQDTTGIVAKNLNIAGESTTTGIGNTINGSFERTVTLTAADTLQTVADKINTAKVGVNAAVISDGSGTTPFRLNLSSQSTGEAGRFVVDTGSLDLGFQTLDAGNNSRVFFGSGDPARALAVTGSSNTIDTLIPGVKIDLKTTSTTAVSLTVASDTNAIQSAVNDFVKAFNTAVDRIAFQTGYDPDTNKRSALLGDSTTLGLRSALFTTAQGTAIGVSSEFDRLADVGVTVTTGGHLSLNSDKFREALSQDPASVEALFSARTQTDDTVIIISPGVSVRNPNSGNIFSSLGIMGQFEQMTSHYIDSVDGLLTTRGNGLDDQIKIQNAAIDRIDLKIESKRSVLQAQFQAMEQAIGRLQTQQGALGSISRVQ